MVYGGRVFVGLSKRAAFTLNSKRRRKKCDLLDVCDSLYPASWILVRLVEPSAAFTLRFCHLKIRSYVSPCGGVALGFVAAKWFGAE